MDIESVTDALLKIITDKIKLKQAAHKVPEHILDIELFCKAGKMGITKAECVAALNKLYVNKKIIVGRTINNKYIKLNL